MNRKEARKIAKKAVYREIFQHGNLLVAELKDGNFLVAKQMEDLRIKLKAIAK